MKIKLTAGINWDLLAKYLVGEADVEEQHIVDCWVSENSKNAEYFALINQLWFTFDIISLKKQINTDEEWQRVKAILKLDEPSSFTVTKAKKSFSTSIYLKVAAAALLFVSIGLSAYFLFYNNHKNNDAELTAMNQVIVPKGHRSQVILSDGTKVWINSGSKLIFPEQFKKSSREVYLEGEAYFDVTHNASRPFYVKTIDVKVKVLGTLFNIRSYPSEGITETTLIKGLVYIERNNTKIGRDAIYLQPNQKAIFIRETPVLKLEAIRKQYGNDLLKKLKPNELFVLNNSIKTTSDIIWKEDQLSFENETLESISRKLEHCFDVKIKVDENLGKIRYTGTFKNGTIEQAMHALRLTSDFEYQIKGDSITIFSRH
ncbi:MAG: FecR family protein [Bacteroidota bacterium]|nr:FecR family protein [Bacteroidota bacterium]